MIPAPSHSEKIFQFFRLLPVRREKCRACRIALAEHKRQVIGIPVGTAGGIGHKQLRLGDGTELVQIPVREVPVLPDFEPKTRVGEGRMGGITTDFLQLGLRGNIRYLGLPVM